MQERRCWLLALVRHCGLTGSPTGGRNVHGKWRLSPTTSRTGGPAAKTKLELATFSQGTWLVTVYNSALSESGLETMVVPLMPPGPRLSVGLTTGSTPDSDTSMDTVTSENPDIRPVNEITAWPL